MSEIKFLKWLSASTVTAWWHDSADPDELENSLDNGAVGVTTNPVLIKQSLYSRPDIWRATLADLPNSLKGADKAEEIQRRITNSLALKLEPLYKKSKGLQGLVCAQVNPMKPNDTEGMIAMAKRLHEWAPNIAVKLPVTKSGLDALEECAAEGMTITATASFTVPQVLAVAERYRKGLQRARTAGIKPGRCFAVIMVGRLDDYIRDVALDSKAKVSESDIIQCGTAAIKRAYEIFNREKYEAILMPAGMRGAYHATELAGANMVLSIHPKIQSMLAKLDEKWEERIKVPIDNEVIKRLCTVTEFVRAYEPDGMKPQEFITYGVTQKTLTQFIEGGWGPIEDYEVYN